MLIKVDNQILTSADKIKYSARRGMLELDIMLEPYLSNCYMLSSLGDKKLFIEFLTSEDNDLFDWFFKDIEPPINFASLIKKIVNEKNRYNQEILK